MFHGSTFYFNRHEKLSATSPVAAPGTPKRPIRNNQYGFSLGGPIVHNKTFFFSTLEVQKLTAGNTTPTTAPSADWVASATQLLNQFGVAVNPTSRNLLALWPADSRTGSAIAQNFVSTDPNSYSSYNGIAKIDHNFNSVHSLSARYFGGGGDQVAQTGSPYLAYYQAVPSRMHNVSVVSTGVFTAHLVNQLVVGYNYFKQTFNSQDHSADPIAMGLNDLQRVQHHQLGEPWQHALELDEFRSAHEHTQRQQRAGHRFWRAAERAAGGKNSVLGNGGDGGNGFTNGGTEETEDERRCEFDA